MAYHILLVEDEPDARDLLAFLLRLRGHTVDVAQGGGEALELLALRSYDVILTDLHMPGMSGEDLYRRIEHTWPSSASRVVFVTAARPARPVQSEYGGRPVPIVTKPYLPDRLLQVIHDVADRRADQ